ncbi:MAG: hypothetical protein P4L92_18770 [Rudaea sp.]|nr:hypothetical protein [Rudaea sp.]
MIQLNEQQRIAAYQRGWNDAQARRGAQPDQPIMYTIGYVEAVRGAPRRFATDLEHQS